MNLNLKSNFLQKKKQEKKKVEQQLEDKTKLAKLQNNLRAYLVRRRLQKTSVIQKDLRFAILLHVDISTFSDQTIHQFVHECLAKTEKQRTPQLTNIILACLKTKSDNLLQLSHSIIETNQQILPHLVSNNAFIELLLQFL